MRSMFVALAFVVSAALAVAADSTIVWRAEVRVRGEADGRDFDNRTPILLYSLLRTRLGVEMKPSRNVRAVIQLQDSRRFGEGASAPFVSDMFSQGELLDLHQGYLELDRLFVEGLSVSVGRMELSYGRERLLGAYEWDNIGRAFDAVRFRYGSGGHAVDLFAADIVGTVSPPRPVAPSTVKQPTDKGYLLSGLWYESPQFTSVKLGGYFLHEWYKRDDLISRGTIGVFADGSTGDILYDAEFAYQGGEYMSMGVSAFMATGSVGLAFGECHRGFVRAGYQYFSGSDLNDATHRTFEPVFHSGHDLAGAMDYFAYPGSATSGRGLQDLFVRVRPVPGEEFSLTVTLHHFLLAKPWSGNRSLGQELDLVGRYSTWDAAALEFGISAFKPDAVMKAWYNGEDLALWGYLGARVWLP